MTAILEARSLVKTYGRVVGLDGVSLQLAGVDVVWQGFAIGLLVLVAVSIDQWIRKVKA